ncbi:MAG: GIY-YIG nuclease family protein [Candidatus Doudnabacteria bacterium]|nr:GIY-YIG nuclease family protein [Candidatus Doudnabacteria bacterium]
MKKKLNKKQFFYFYILLCKDNSLYCGSTKNLQKRELAHNTNKGSAYVRSRGGGKIIYFEKFDSWSETLKREALVKKWNRSQKLLLTKFQDKRK